MNFLNKIGFTRWGSSDTTKDNKERGDRKEAGDEKKFRAQTQVDSPIAQLVRALH